MHVLLAAVIAATASGCASRETYGDPATPDGVRAVVDGYWRCWPLYDEENGCSSESTTSNC
jgi:hypothetical protein